MVEALRKVKEEFGEEAVILESGKISEENQEYYEIVAAIEEEEVKEVYLNTEAPKLEKGDLLYEDLKKELLDIKRFLKEIFSSQSLPGLSFKLIKDGVPEEIALEIERSSLGIPQFIREALRKKGANPFSKIQVFIGEPGVGKTTSIFKIAFWYKIKRNARVIILSMDNYKIGGQDQLEKLSKFLEIPYRKCDWEEFKEYYPQIKVKYDLILVDTHSLGKKFSPLDLNEISRQYPFLRYHWVVRSTENSENILTLWEELKSLPVEALVLTFLDRINKGTHLFWALKEDIPMPVFASTGERIPEDLYKLEENILLDLFLRGVGKEAK